MALVGALPVERCIVVHDDRLRREARLDQSFARTRASGVALFSLTRAYSSILSGLASPLTHKMSRGWPFCFGGSIPNLCKGVLPDGSFLPHWSEGAAAARGRFRVVEGLLEQIRVVFVVDVRAGDGQHSPPKNASLSKSASVV